MTHPPSDQRVIVTGCAGFIGAAVTETLLEQGAPVLGVDNLNDAYDPRLKLWRLDRLKSRPRFEFHEGDIRAASSLESLFDPVPYAVLNLAARAGVRQSLENPGEYLDTNAGGTLTLLELCRKHDVGRFVLASTSSLYGGSNAIPFREDANTDRPLSPYAASKKAAEALLASYAHLYGVHAPILRYFTVYGPAGRPDMSVFRFIRGIAEGEPLVVYGDGAQERDFTYVDDIARGTVAALQIQGLEVINLGGDRPTKLSTVIALLEHHLGREAVVRHEAGHPADVQVTWADTSKARRLLGWAPRVPLEEGLQRAVAWYEANRAWASELRAPGG